jgi:predicted acylesterase/phospholipase RssA
VPPDGLRALLARHLRFARLEDAPVPLRVVAGEVTTGREVLRGTGDTGDAVAASAAIPGVFPPVLLDGQLLMDGGVANNAPVSHAIELGAEPVDFRHGGDLIERAHTATRGWLDAGPELDDGQRLVPHHHHARPRP